MFADRVRAYLELMRADRPAGALLLLWPTITALWLAAGGVPRAELIAAFVAGTFVMRAAGCVMNDIADRDFDAHVARTRGRPLATGAATLSEAALLLVVLAAIGLAILLTLNAPTRWLGAAGVVVIAAYPFFKRFTHLPQLVLAVAFGWGIPMAYTAVTGTTGAVTWYLFAANALWIVAYDTIYAMVDRDDDLRVGIRSAAILLGDADRLAIGALQAGALAVLAALGVHAGLGAAWYAGVAGFGASLVAQQVLIRGREPGACLAAFRLNAWGGAALFAGAAADTLAP